MEKTKGKKARRYCCSNPNCHKVFSRPKIIKYYVCPSCQTLVDLPSDKTPIQPILREKHVLIKEPRKLRKQKSIEPTIKQEIEPINLYLIEPEKNEAHALEPTHFDFNEKQEVTTTETASPSSSARCSYYFGYLNQREKGETIPETCNECYRSLECMLSEHYGSKEAIKEIKKWYSFNR